MLKPFLTANWRYLAMLNFVADPKLLEPLLPRGTELDFHEGKTFLSVVGFLFLDTRVLGLPIPLHRDFEEVNLRFYVRRRSVDEWRRGVAFVRELVPRQAIAVVARTLYGEPYSAVPMRHRLEHTEGRLHAEYQWRRGGRWETLAMTATGEPQGSPFLLAVMLQAIFSAPNKFDEPAVAQHLKLLTHLLTNMLISWIKRL